jgi:mono/diheme cytochrome c family protein
MADGYLKCPCDHCELNIEFPVQSVGEIVRCPHCQLPTPLTVPAPETVGAEVGGAYAKWLIATVIFSLILVIVTVGGLFYAKNLKKKKGIAPAPAAQNAGTPAAQPAATGTSGAVPAGDWKLVQPVVGKFQGGYSADQISGGRYVLTGNCVECHGVYNPARYEKQKWDTTLSNMRGRAKLNNRDYEDLVRFVATIR